MKPFAIAVALTTSMTSVGLTVPANAATVTSTVTYDLDIDSAGSIVAPPVGTVTITSNSKADTLQYKISLTDGSKLTGVFMDAGGGTIRDQGSVLNSLGTFTNSFSASGKSFTVTFKGTDMAHFTLNGFTEIFAGVNTTKGLFADAFIQLSAPTAVPVPGALPLFVSGLGAMGLLGWRRKRKAPLAAS